MSYRVGGSIINKDTRVSSNRWRFWLSDIGEPEEAKHVIYCFGLDNVFRSMNHNNKNEIVKFKYEL